MSKKHILLFLLFFSNSFALHAKDQKGAEIAPPKVYGDVVACRSIENAEARLACYDEKVTILDEAQKRKDIVLTDKEAVKATKKGLFGFDLPSLKIFGDDDDEDEVKEIESVVKSASQSREGALLVTLADGARWQQIDTKILNRKIKEGMTVRIRKASLGSFLVNIDSLPAIRMKRIN